MGDMADMEAAEQLDPYWGDDEADLEDSYIAPGRTRAPSIRVCKPGEWLGKYKKRHLIVEMQTSHIVNVLKLLDRQYWASVDINGLGRDTVNKKAVRMLAAGNPTYRELSTESGG